MSVRWADDPSLFARVREQDLLRQYDLSTNCIEIGLRKGIEAFRSSKATVARLVQLATTSFAFVTARCCRARRSPYYAALQAADRHWADGHFNVDELAAYLQRLLLDQLSE